MLLSKRPTSRFNTQPPEGGWGVGDGVDFSFAVSTHSRLKAAGTFSRLIAVLAVVSTHSRLKAAGLATVELRFHCLVSTHSRLKAAGTVKVDGKNAIAVSTHSRLKAAVRIRSRLNQYCWFQHTAA